jgi:threonine dehydratase
MESMKNKNYKITDLSDDEISKVHLRYMSGGRAPEFIDGNIEEVFKVDFPERPGALMQFLELLKDKWNITLFHYKNQGSIYGGALVGFSLKSEQLKALNRDLLKTEYPFVRVSDNAGYKAFLK